MAEPFFEVIHDIEELREYLSPNQEEMLNTVINFLTAV
jgi:hypothetical protein